MQTYRIDKKEEAVAQVQRDLRAISYKHTAVPHVGVDGIFGEETRTALLAFQSLFSLAETGEADAETFALLYEEYREATKKRDKKARNG